jgi:signal transduction histidine kinase
LKKHEIESLLKNFLLFFSSLGLFLGLIFYLDYKQKLSDLDQKIFSQMRLCSFDLECPDFKIDFVDKEGKKPLFLYSVNSGLEAYFAVPNSKNYFLSLHYMTDKYKKERFDILKEDGIRFIFYLLLIAVMSVLFSLYALYPMKKAIVTIEEFIKDILHDFNTPISSIVLNTSLLERDDKNRQKILRIQQSTQTILALEENLKAYLGELKTQKEEFDLKALIIHKQRNLQKIYPDIKWEIDTKTLKLKANKNAFSRVLSNIIENAAKYNNTHGKIITRIDQKRKTLEIIDTGVGIKNPQKIFERFYTESERGTGIGLHIVKKLCDELNISIDVTSSKDKGSKFMLDLKELTHR